MVHLRIYPECKKGDHAKCPGSHTSRPGVYGGSRCTCSCHNSNSGKTPTMDLSELVKLSEGASQERATKDGWRIGRLKKKELPLEKCFVDFIKAHTPPKK